MRVFSAILAVIMIVATIVAASILSGVIVHGVIDLFRFGYNYRLGW